MADLASELEPFAAAMIGPDEELLGACIASRQSGMKGWMVAIAVTEERLLIQRLQRSKTFAADGPPLELTAADIAAARAGRGGSWGATPTAEIMDAASVQLKLKTTAGEKLKLMMMRGEGALFEESGGGEIQARGVRALGEWFERVYGPRSAQ